MVVITVRQISLYIHIFNFLVLFSFNSLISYVFIFHLISEFLKQEEKLYREYARIPIETFKLQNFSPISIILCFSFH